MVNKIYIQLMREQRLGLEWTKVHKKMNFKSLLIINNVNQHSTMKEGHFNRQLLMLLSNRVKHNHQEVFILQGIERNIPKHHFIHNIKSHFMLLKVN